MRQLEDKAKAKAQGWEVTESCGLHLAEHDGKIIEPFGSKKDAWEFVFFVINEQIKVS